MLALRWYANEKLEVKRDLVVISAHDMAEVLEKANEHGQLFEALTAVRDRLEHVLGDDASRVRWAGEAQALWTEINEVLGEETSNAGDD